MENDINPFEKKDEIIVITDIKIKTCRQTPSFNYTAELTPLYEQSPFLDDSGVKSELVHGRRFRRPSDGKYIVIGVPKELADIIGIQYEDWERKEKLIESCTKRIIFLKNEVDYYSKNLLILMGQSFWERIKWAFSSKHKRYSWFPD